MVRRESEVLQLGTIYLTISVTVVLEGLQWKIEFETRILYRIRYIQIGTVLHVCPRLLNFPYALVDTGNVHLYMKGYCLNC